MSSSIIETVVENPDSISIANDIAILKNSNKNINIISPLNYFNNTNTTTTTSNNNVLLILNQEINTSPYLFLKIWNNSNLKICADGGINRLRTYTKKYNEILSNSKLIPDFIIGDLDSATSENLTYYQSKGSIKILQSSQYYTDFMKSIALINVYFNFNKILSNLSNLNTIDDLEKLEIESFQNYEKNSKNLKNLKIFVLGGIGGRFDQTLSTINQIYKFSIDRSNLNFIILNPEHTELILLLNKGINLIDYPRLSNEKEIEIFGFNIIKSRTNLRNIGVLPILKDSVISTKGLKWDVENWSSSITSKLSSSNLQVGNEGFIIKSDNPLFIDLEL